MNKLDSNAAGNALYVDPPRNLFRRLVIEFLVVLAALALPMWVVHRWRLLEGPPTAQGYWIYFGVVAYYTAWALGFAGNFLRKAWLTASSGRTPHVGAFVLQRTRVRYGAPAWIRASVYAALGIAIAYGVVHVWVVYDFAGTLSAGVPAAGAATGR